MSDRDDKPLGYAREERKAGKLLAQPERLRQVVADAGDKLAGVDADSGRFAAVRSELSVLMDLVRAWLSGDYRGVSNASLLGIVAAIVYFLNPFDLVPDFLLGFGLIDDAAVIGYVINRVSGELERFRVWRARDPAEDGSAGNSEEPR